MCKVHTLHYALEIIIFDRESNEGNFDWLLLIF